MPRLKEIHVDWNDNYGNGQVGLSCRASLETIRDNRIELREGLRVKLYGDTLEAEGIVKLRPSGKVWIAEVVPGTLKEIDIGA